MSCTHALTASFSRPPVARGSRSEGDKRLASLAIVESNAGGARVQTRIVKKVDKRICDPIDCPMVEWHLCFFSLLVNFVGDGFHGSRETVSDCDEEEERIDRHASKASAREREAIKCEKLMKTYCRKTRLSRRRRYLDKQIRQEKNPRERVCV